MVGFYLVHLGRLVVCLVGVICKWVNKNKYREMITMIRRRLSNHVEISNILFDMQIRLKLNHVLVNVVCMICWKLTLVSSSFLHLNYLSSFSTNSIPRINQVIGAWNQNLREKINSCGGWFPFDVIRWNYFFLFLFLEHWHHKLVSDV